ncbi:MAG TPA: HD domain-containing phosphohydrolase [Acidimicrobiia bacterium]|nr:HD domain-containing phosphohydrolase [Acidimicrobiia bacterium]
MSNFPRRLRWYTAALAVGALGTAVALGRSEPFPTVLPLALFCALVVFSEARTVHLPSGVGVTATFMVGMAAVVVFRDEGTLLGPLLVGMATGLPLLRRRRTRPWVLFNACANGLAHVVAAAAFWVVPNSVVEEMPLALLGALPPAAAFVLASLVLIGGSFIIDGSRSAREVVADFAPSTVQVLPFAVLGVFLGRLYLDVGLVVVLLIVVPIMVAREVFAAQLEVRAAHEATVRMLIRALEAKDRYTAGHAERVARYALYIGEELGFGPARLERLRFAALMHDIGKLVVPNHLLNKPGKLTSEEFARVRVHETVSVEMLQRIDFLRPVAPVAHSDHTKFDPDDPSRPIEPYIVMVADAYDAMTSTRSYRRALPQDVAFAELREKSGTQFHPDCVKALIRAIERRGEHHGRGHEEPDVIEFTDAPEAGLGSAGLGDLLSSDGGALGSKAGGAA